MKITPRIINDQVLEELEQIEMDSRHDADEELTEQKRLNQDEEDFQELFWQDAMDRKAENRVRERLSEEQRSLQGPPLTRRRPIIAPRRRIPGKGKGAARRPSPPKGEGTPER